MFLRLLANTDPGFVRNIGGRLIGHRSSVDRIDPGLFHLRMELNGGWRFGCSALRRPAGVMSDCNPNRTSWHTPAPPAPVPVEVIRICISWQSTFAFRRIYSGRSVLVVVNVCVSSVPSTL